MFVRACNIKFVAHDLISVYFVIYLNLLIACSSLAVSFSIIVLSVVHSDIDPDWINALRRFKSFKPGYIIHVITD